MFSSTPGTKLPVSGKFADWPRGVLNTFGAYQTYYETQELFSASSSTISWVGSVQSSLLLVLGLLTGPLYDAGYFHVLLPAGSFLIVFGQMMLSISHEYYQVLLAQGICVGIGAGLIFIPGVAILSTYFDKKLAIANGIAAAGSGVGEWSAYWMLPYAHRVQGRLSIPLFSIGFMSESALAGLPAPLA